MDGNFLLAGLRVREGSFDGMLEEMDDTPNTPDQMGVWVRGRFSGQQRHASGTIQAGSRSCDSYQQLSFTARRVRSLPARPVNGRQYAGRTARGSAIAFCISRSGRRLIGFRVAPVATSCTDSDKWGRLALADSRPISGLRQRADGSFSGVLSSRVTPRHPARTRFSVRVLFLSRAEAGGSVRLLGRNCSYETLTWRAHSPGKLRSWRRLGPRSRPAAAFTTHDHEHAAAHHPQ